MKNWIQKHMIAVWAICSILFAIIIHLLFHWETDIEILHAKWEAGDILTYVSTVALGLLAVWQNKRFKEENDVAQERLEKLTAQANEISMINKIIEIESKHLLRLENAVDEFSEACKPETIFRVYLAESATLPPDTDVISNISKARARVDNSFRTLVRELPYDSRVDSVGEIIILIDAMKQLRRTAREYLNQVQEHLTEPVDSQLTNNMVDAQKEFDRQKEAVLINEKKKLNKTIYGNLPLQEIKALYYNTNHTTREET